MTCPGVRTNESTDGDEDVFAAVSLIKGQKAHSRSTGHCLRRQCIRLRYLLIYCAVAATCLCVSKHRRSSLLNVYLLLPVSMLLPNKKGGNFARLFRLEIETTPPRRLLSVCQFGVEMEQRIQMADRGLTSSRDGSCIYSRDKHRHEERRGKTFANTFYCHRSGCSYLVLCDQLDAK